MFNTGFPDHWTTLKKLLFMVGSGIAGGASAIWKTVTGSLIHITDALASPVQELSIAIEPLQSGSGDPSPTNVRPITGWTGCNIYRSGADTSSPTTYPISWETEAGTVYGGTLTINQDGSVDLVKDRSGFDGGNATWVKGGSSYKYGTFYVQANGAKRSNVSSVYVISSQYKGVSDNGASASGDNYVWVRYVSATNKQIQVKDTSKASLTETELKTAMTGVTFVYYLNTPVTYHLDSIEQLYTLVGENNIWTDVNGEITLTYKANA